jgi:hypothetical protein
MVSPVWLSELGVDAYSFSRIVPPQSFSDDEDVVESDSPKSPLTAQRLKRGKQWLKCMAKWILLKDADVGYWALNSIYYESEGNASRSSWGLLADKGGHSHVKNQQLMDVLHAFMLVSEGPGVNSSPLLPTLPKDMSEFLKREKEQRLIAHFGSTDLLHLHSSFRPRRAERAY